MMGGGPSGAGGMGAMPAAGGMMNPMMREFVDLLEGQCSLTEACHFRSHDEPDDEPGHDATDDADDAGRHGWWRRCGWWPGW